MSNFQWVWRYSCLNVTHKKPYKRYEGKTNDVLIAYIGYVKDLNKLQQFKVSVLQEIQPSTSVHFSTILATVRVALLRSSWRSCFTRAALFIMQTTNSSLRLDHIQRRITVSRTSLDEWSARRRDLYLTTHNTQHRHTSMPPVGFEPTIPGSERPYTYALDRAAICTTS